MSKKEKQEVEVEISVLKTIYNAAIPIYTRLFSLLEDVFTKKILLSETDTAVLLEFSSCAVTLKVLFEDFFSRAAITEDGQKMVLTQQEFITIMNLSKTVELSTRTSFGNTTIQEH